jgi:D-alanyl-D-alanine carboxypeptidase (penicillin-binding protein 5/6)
MILGLFLLIFLFFLPNNELFYLPFWPQNSAFRIEDIPVSAQPLLKENFSNPSVFFPISAKSFVVVDFDSGKLIASRQPFVAFPPASLTKLLTALVAVDYYKPNDILLADKEYSVGKNMGLAAGEEMKAIDLLRGLLIHSANDAAYVLASNYPGGREAFVEKMNEKMREIGLTKSHFANFDGEIDRNHFSTPLDLAILSRYFLKNDLLSQIVRVPQMTVYSVNGRFSHDLETTNELLGKVPENKGVKTGWTQEAGECFIGYFEFDDLSLSKAKRRLIIVVLGSQDRFADTKRLFEWARNNLIWQDYSLIHSGEIASMNPKKLPSP